MHSPKEGKTEVEVICEKHIGDEHEEMAMEYAKKMFEIAKDKHHHHIYEEVHEILEAALDEEEEYVAEKTPLLDAYYHVRECLEMTEDMLEKVSADTSLSSKYRLPIVKELKEGMTHITGAEEMLKYAMKIVFK